MNIESVIKVTTVLVAVLTLVFGVVKYVRLQEIEAAKPYLEKKLAWCTEAVETASAIANDPKLAADPDDTNETERRFWELYWGVMGLVEKGEVTEAMINYGNELKANRKLKDKALAIAHACRKELAHDWSAKWNR